MPNLSPHLFSALCGLACVLLISLLACGQAAFGSRYRRGRLLLVLPLSAGRKVRLALTALGLLALLTGAATATVVTWSGTSSLLALLCYAALLVLSSALIYTLFSFRSPRLYEHGLQDHAGFLSWMQLVCDAESPQGLRLRRLNRNPVQSAHWGRTFLLPCPQDLRQRAREVLEEGRTRHADFREAHS